MPMTATELEELRDKLLEAAVKDLDAATESAGFGKDARNFATAADGRRELAWTLDSIADRKRRRLAAADGRPT